MRDSSGRDIQADTRTSRTAGKWAWSPSRRGLTTRSTSTGRLHVIAYRATLDVPRELAWFVAKLLLAERHRRGTPRGSRALSCFWQAVLGLRWFRDRTTPDALARDDGISRATAYRYLDEVIAVLADQAPGLRQALERAKDEGLSHVILDGKIIATDRCKEKTTSTKDEVIDLWYSGKAHAHGGNIQAVLAPDGFPLWVSEVEPGSVHDLTAARPTPCPGCTGPPRLTCPLSPTRLRRHRHRHPYPGQAAPRRAATRYWYPHGFWPPPHPRPLRRAHGRPRARGKRRS